MKTISKSRENNYGFETTLNTAVFTTVFILNNKKTITHVSHYLEDGAWEFLSDDPFEDIDSVIKIVSLEEIIILDPSIVELSDLKEGYCASRVHKEDRWVKQRLK